MNKYMQEYLEEHSDSLINDILFKSDVEDIISTLDENDLLAPINIASVLTRIDTILDKSYNKWNK